MPYTLSVRINPDCLNQVQDEKNVSARQNTFIESIKDLHATVNLLKKQDDLQFDEKQMAEISRGAFYALSPSLEEKSTKEEITLPDLQNVLNMKFQIKDKSTIDFIIKSLLEPHSLPLALPLLAYSVLTDDSYWTRECTTLESEESKFKYTLKAKHGPSGSIIFSMRMNLRNAQRPENSSLGALIIQFSVNHQKQIKLLPLNMDFNFVDKKTLQAFKQELCCDFRDWIFLPTSHWPTTDLWVIPVLLGCLLGLIAMISLLALSLTPISPLLLPPLGLALGLCLASVMHTCVHISVKKQLEKAQRPIHILNRKPLQTTAFFNHHSSKIAMASEGRLPRATRSQ